MGKKPTNKSSLFEAFGLYAYSREDPHGVAYYMPYVFAAWKRSSASQLFINSVKTRDL